MSERELEDEIKRLRETLRHVLELLTVNEPAGPRIEKALRRLQEHYEYWQPQ